MKPPFIRAKVSSSGMTWQIVAALAPVAGICVYVAGFKALAVLMLTIFSAAAAEAVWRGISRQKVRLNDGSAVLAGLLTAFLLPASSPGWLAALAGAFAVIAGRELFGGTGCYVFQPALLTKIVLLSLFPHTAAGWLLPLQIRWAALLLNPALLIAGFVLVQTRVIPARLPYYYLATALAVSLVLGRDALGDMLTGRTFLMAFFYLPDFACVPAAEKGRVCFGIFSALFGAVLKFMVGLADGELYGILFMNAATPVFDRYVRPKFLGESDSF